MIVILLAFHLADLWQRITRDTSSHAANARGIQQIAKQQYPQAAASFAKAYAIAPTPVNAYNLGTAQIAAGRREEGAAALTKALADPTLRADAYYNRGNAALISHAFDNAIRDYTESLRLRPNDPQAKRNLEIALLHQAMQRAAASRGGQSGPQPKPRPGERAPAPGDRQQQQKGDPNLEALLRSVQQQEQEELTRMHRTRQESVRVGW